MPNHAKKDSTGICFIGERPFREFLNRYLAREPGPIMTPEGMRIGTHIGLAFYTIGQRKGIGIGGKSGAGGGKGGDAWYVAQKDLGANALIVGQGHDHLMLMKNALRAANASWIQGMRRKRARRIQPARATAADSACIVTRSDDEEIALEFAQPQGR